MTQEEKELLLGDLCARLPYQPMCEFTDTEDNFCTATAALGYSLRGFIAGKILIKPYLRPMDSMTEEEVGRRCAFLDDIEGGIEEAIPNYIDWLNKNKFDYRGLISMGLALPAKEGMYNQ